MRISSPIEIQEEGGDRFQDLETVQALARPGLAGELARVLHELLLSGALVIRDGKIIVNPESER